MREILEAIVFLASDTLMKVRQAPLLLGLETRRRLREAILAADPWRDLLAEGAFLGDVIRVQDKTARFGEQERERALKRLITTYFTQGAVFHPGRWHLLERHFLERKPEDQSWQGFYLELCAPALSLAIMEIPNEMPIGEIYGELRRKTQKDIERSLLDGETLDQYASRFQKRIPLPDEESPEAARLQAETREELDAIKLADIRLDLFRALDTLEPEERQLFSDRRQEYSYKELSEKYDVSHGTLRKRYQRLRQELAKKMQDNTLAN